MMTPTAAPWDSPNVVMRKRWPNVLPIGAYFLQVVLAARWRPTRDEKTMPVPPNTPSRLKQLVFVGILATAGALVSLLTVYKLSVANAYRIFYAQTALTVAIPTDAASLAWGLHLTEDVMACQSCHGADLGGRVLKDDAVAIVSAPNLTVLRDDADWLRALRLGVDAEGRGLWMMPSRAHSALSDRDLGAIVASIRARPRILRPLPQSHLRLAGHWAVATRQWRPLAIDASRTQAPSEALAVRPDAAFGGYLAELMQCASCHEPKAAPSGALARAHDGMLQAAGHKDAAAFKAALLAEHPSHKAPQNAGAHTFAAPPAGFAHLTNVEFEALWRYFQGA